MIKVLNVLYNIFITFSKTFENKVYDNECFKNV